MLANQIKIVPTGRHTETAEVWPPYCRNGHRLGPGRVLGYYQAERDRVLPCEQCGDEQDRLTGYSYPVSASLAHSTVKSGSVDERAFGEAGPAPRCG
jgi:hypothetical protein